MDEIEIVVRESRYKEAADTFSGRTGIPVVETQTKELSVVFEEEGISLAGNGMSYRGDFEGMLRRVTGGRLGHEMLIKAAKTDLDKPLAIDATAGMGEDSLLLAAYGYEVIMFEQNPVVALLLRDALDRAGENDVLRPIVERMHLHEGNSLELLGTIEDTPHIVYLDPMFPARQKSGLIGKKLQLIQRLEPPCAREDELLQAAISTGASKIVVKRPVKSPFFAGVSPNHSLEGKSIRYDCYVGKR